MGLFFTLIQRCQLQFADLLADELKLAGIEFADTAGNIF